MKSTVTVRGQTVIPKDIRKKYNLKPKTRLEWIDDGKTITVIPIIENPIRKIKGLHRNSNLRQALLKSRREERKRV